MPYEVGERDLAMLCIGHGSGPPFQNQHCFLFLFFLNPSRVAAKTSRGGMVQFSLAEMVAVHSFKNLMCESHGAEMVPHHAPCAYTTSWSSFRRSRAEMVSSFRRAQLYKPHVRNSKSHGQKWCLESMISPHRAHPHQRLFTDSLKVTQMPRKCS